MIGLHYDIMRYHVIIVRPENQHMYFSKIGLTVSRFTGVDGHEKKNSDLVYHKSTSITCYNSCRHYMAIAMDHGFFLWYTKRDSHGGAQAAQGPCHWDSKYPAVMIHGWLGNSLLSLINYIYTYICTSRRDDKYIMFLFSSLDDRRLHGCKL